MRIYDLEPQDVCFAQLVACGYSEDEACSVIYRPLRQSLSTSVKRLYNQKPEIQKLIDSMRADIDALTNRQVATAKRRKPVVDKDSVLTELSKQYNLAKEGKERADIMMKIADILQIKKEEDKDNDKRITYYLPLRCEICPHKK